MIRIAVLCAIVCYPFAAWGQTSSAPSVVQGSSAQGMSRFSSLACPNTWDDTWLRRRAYRGALLICAAVLLAAHGATYLTLKTEGAVQVIIVGGGADTTAAGDLKSDRE